MGRHWVDLDEDALAAARAELGTQSIRATVNEALRRAGYRRGRVASALDRLAKADLGDRDVPWR